jgi:predicted flap endonuclease-1-like 5' DNA nuclease
MENMTALVDIEGVGEKYAEKLKVAGVGSTEALLEKGKNPAGRKKIAEASGVSEKLVLEWVNRVDLARIKGVGSEYADLLESSGVDTVVELSKRVPENLLKKMEEINTTKKLVRKMPVLSQVADWVEQAKKLPRIISY